MTKEAEHYADLIREFKVRLGVDAGSVREDVKEVLKYAKEEILKLRATVNREIGKGLELKKDAQAMASMLYIQREYIDRYNLPAEATLKIFEGVVDKVQIDRKMKILLEGPIAAARDEIVEENKKLHRLIRKMLKV